MSKNKYDGKHLLLSQRIIIEKGLNNNESFVSIGRKIGKDPSTVSKEVRRNVSRFVKNDANIAVSCAKRTNCMIRNLYDTNCTVLCKICRKPKFQCATICKQYEERICERLIKPPYVCNSCFKRSYCILRKAYYTAQYAQNLYKDKLTSSGEGINQTPMDIMELDSLISPLLKKGQSMAHIYANHAAEIPFCRRTLYNYIDRGVFAARNLDMRKRVRYRLRKKPTKVSLLARKFRVGRSYDDYQKLIKEHPDISVVQMDIVEGSKGSGKVFLTMLFCDCSLLLIFLLNDKSPANVSGVFDWLEKQLSIKVFKELFGIILTDNGVEFQQPERLECNAGGKSGHRFTTVTRTVLGKKVCWRRIINSYGLSFLKAKAFTILPMRR